MSVDLKSLFSLTPALKSVMRAEDLGAESLARHLPWLSAPHDDVILTRQGDLMASAAVAGQDSFTCEEAELTLATASLARLIGQLGEAFGFYISKLSRVSAERRCRAVASVVRPSTLAKAEKGGFIKITLGRRSVSR